MSCSPREHRSRRRHDRRAPSRTPSDAGAELPTAWWRDAVVYQVYVRSFADANGDGIGDLAGVRAGCRTCTTLGVDALWFNPWYPSPLADTGYDVVDYRVDRSRASARSREAEQLIAEARALGIRTIVDIVPNHVSNQHPWFREALASPAGLPRARALLVPARHGARRRAAAERLAVDLRRLRPGRASRRRTASGTSTSSRPSSPT